MNRLLGMGVPLAPAGGSLRPGIVHRLDAGTSRPDGRGQDGRRVRGVAEHVPRPCRAARLPGARPGRRCQRFLRGRCSPRPAGGQDRGGRDGRPSGGDALRGPRAPGTRDAAGGRPPDGPHAPDPCAPGGDRPSDPRGPSRTGEEATTRGGSAWIARSCMPGACRSCIRLGENGSSSRKTSPGTSHPPWLAADDRRRLTALEGRRRLRPRRITVM